MVLRVAQTQAVSMILISGIVLAMVAVTYNWGAPMVEKSQTSSRLIQAQEVMSMVKQRITDAAMSGEQKSFRVNLDGTLEISPLKNSVIYSVTTEGLGIGSMSYISLDSASDAFSYETYALNASTGGIINLAGEDYNVSGCTVDDAVNINGTSHNAGDDLFWNADYMLDHVDCTGLFDEFTVITGPEEEVVGLLGIDTAGVVMAKTAVVGTQYLNRMRLAYRELDDTTTLEGYKIIIHSEGNSMASAGERTINIRRENIERVPSGSSLGEDLVLTHIYISIL